MLVHHVAISLEQRHEELGLERRLDHAAVAGLNVDDDHVVLPRAATNARSLQRTDFPQRKYDTYQGRKCLTCREKLTDRQLDLPHGTRNRTKLECRPMPNVMVALPNIGGALCSTPQSLADARCRAVTLQRRETR